MVDNNLIINKQFPIIIDCITGQATINIRYNTILWPNGQLQKETENQELSDPKLICYLSSLRYGQTKQQTQSAGDMIISNDLVFNQQNHFDEKANIVNPWSEQDKTACYKLQYDGDIPLQHFQLQYKNLYL